MSLVPGVLAEHKFLMEDYMSSVSIDTNNIVNGQALATFDTNARTTNMLFTNNSEDLVTVHATSAPGSSNPFHSKYSLGIFGKSSTASNITIPIPPVRCVWM